MFLADEKELLAFLKESRRTTELREKFGTYPRGQLHLLYEAGAIEKTLTDFVRWQMIEEDTEEIKALTSALEKAGNLINEVRLVNTETDIAKAEEVLIALDVELGGHPPEETTSEKNGIFSKFTNALKKA